MNESNEIGFEALDAASFVVAVAQFDFAALDSPEDFVRENIAAGKPVLPLIQAWAMHLAQCEQAATVRALVDLIMESDNPKRRVQEIMYACGMSEEGVVVTQQSIAKKYHVKKQAVNKSIKLIQRRLGLRKARTMRSEVGRQAMAKAYRATHPGQGIY